MLIPRSHPKSFRLLMYVLVGLLRCSAMGVGPGLLLLPLLPRLVLQALVIGNMPARQLPDPNLHFQGTVLPGAETSRKQTVASPLAAENDRWGGTYLRSSYTGNLGELSDCSVLIC